jgi:hypothetical protein
MKLILFSMVACAPRKETRGSQESEAQAVSRPLPIVGTWKAEAYDGYYYPNSSDREQVILKRADMRTEDWSIVTNIDPYGNGSLTTKIICSGVAKSSPNPGIPVPRNFVVFPAPSQLRRCDNGVATQHTEMHTFIATEASRLPRTVVESSGGFSLSKECSKLRGKRYVVQQSSFNPRIGSTGCIGFTDGSADLLTLLLVPHGEVRPLRISLKRAR